MPNIKRVVHGHDQENHTYCGLEIPEENEDAEGEEIVLCVDDPDTGMDCVACWRSSALWAIEQLMGKVGRAVSVELLIMTANAVDKVTQLFPDKPKEDDPRFNYPKWYRTQLRVQGTETSEEGTPFAQAIMASAGDTLPSFAELNANVLNAEGQQTCSSMARGLLVAGLTNAQVLVYINTYYPA